jgi:ElaB/YqjD/DUF883 family membrane-anchored ribosome-binding protein
MSDEDYASLFRQPPKRDPGAAWEDVAREFQALGDNLGAALRAAWQRRETNERLAELQESLQSMIDGVNRTIAESTSTREAEAAREQLSRVTESVRVAVERTTDEFRPQLLAVLRRANAELRHLAGLPDEPDAPPPGRDD